MQKRSNLRSELAELNREIIERKRYLRNLELQIAEVTDAGNTKLMGLQHDVLVAKQTLRDLKTDIRTAARDKQLLNHELDSLQVTIVQQTTFVGVSPAFG